MKKSKILASSICLSAIISFSANAAEEKKQEVLTGSFDGGISFSNGNTKEESSVGNVKLVYKPLKSKWENILKLEARNRSESDVRVEEEYKANNQTRYLLSDRAFALLELEYFKDRFGGFDKRTSETLGLGYKIINDEKITLSVDYGTGFRQSDLTDGTKENNWLNKVGADFTWEILENLNFEQNIDVSFDSDNTITESDSSLKINLGSGLFLRANINLENRKEVPAGVKNTDTTTELSLGYQF